MGYIPQTKSDIKKTKGETKITSKIIRPDKPSWPDPPQLKKIDSKPLLAIHQWNAYENAIQ